MNVATILKNNDAQHLPPVPCVAQLFGQLV
jgi:hypothetical protein